MTDQVARPMTEPTRATTPTGVEPGGRASVLKVLRDQRKTIILAAALAAAAFWVAGQLGEWRLAGCIAGGIGLGLRQPPGHRVLAAQDHHFG